MSPGTQAALEAAGGQETTLHPEPPETTCSVDTVPVAPWK